jgi:hypothetical protein
MSINSFKLRGKKKPEKERSIYPPGKRKDRTADLENNRYYQSHENEVLEMQQRIGNDAVTRLIENGELQTKLSVGNTGDIYEQEADRVADYIMNMSEPRIMKKEPLGTPPTDDNEPDTETNTASAPTITFDDGVNQDTVSQLSLNIISGILTAAGEDSAVISSTTRTPAQQASAMYNNIVAQGVESQLALYGSNGDQVIETYVQSLEAGKTEQEILADMEAKINELGPSNVSKHCGDPAVLQAIDIRPSSIENDEAFITAVNDAITAGTVTAFYQPPNDPGYHLEIPQ